MKKSIYFGMVVILLSLMCTSCNEDVLPLGDKGQTELPAHESLPSDENGNENSSDISIIRYKVVNGKLEQATKPDVQSSMSAYQDNLSSHQKIWNHFKKISRKQEIKLIQELDLYYGGESAGYVSELNAELTEWKLGIAINLYDEDNKQDFNDFMYTLIHESAHLITLQSGQLNVAPGACTTFHTGEGCSSEKSMIYRNYVIGWQDIFKPDEEINYFQLYPERFVSEYAATNPGEDIAEVFTHFVLKEKPIGTTIADKKVLALYDRKDIVSLRDKIRRNYPNTTLPSQQRRSHGIRGHHRCGN